MQQQIGLADAVESLREELELALRKAEGRVVRFGLESVELTLEVAVSWVGEAKLGWSVIGAGGSRESGRTQTLTLTLSPKLLDPAGNEQAVNISGDLDANDVIGGAPGPRHSKG